MWLSPSLLSVEQSQQRQSSQPDPSPPDGDQSEIQKANQADHEELNSQKMSDTAVTEACDDNSNVGNNILCDDGELSDVGRTNDDANVEGRLGVIAFSMSREVYLSIRYHTVSLMSM